MGHRAAEPVVEQFVVLVDELHVLTPRQADTDVAWAARPPRVLDPLSDDVRVRGGEALQLRPGLVVRGPVVDEHHLEGVLRQGLPQQ